VLAAAAQAGFPVVADVNRGNQEGFTRAQVTMHRGRRRSAAAAYLHPVMYRKNLRVETNTIATQLLLRDELLSG
jgi:choline dehydrogenase